VLLVGWVLYDNTDMNINKTSVAKTDSGIKTVISAPVKKDTVYVTGDDTVAHIVMNADTTVVSEGEQLFMAQTNDGIYVTEEKGTGVFFPRAGKSSNGIYFAFHNTAKRGTIIRIHNPGSDKTIYAKVIGTLPVRDAFYNALIGISSDAKSELETGGDKMWCEISW